MGIIRKSFDRESQTAEYVIVDDREEKASKAAEERDAAGLLRSFGLSTEPIGKEKPGERGVFAIWTRLPDKCRARPIPLACEYADGGEAAVLSELLMLIIEKGFSKTLGFGPLNEETGKRGLGCWSYLKFSRFLSFCEEHGIKPSEVSTSFTPFSAHGPNWNGLQSLNYAVPLEGKCLNSYPAEVSTDAEDLMYMNEPERLMKELLKETAGWVTDLLDYSAECGRKSEIRKIPAICAVADALSDFCRAHPEEKGFAGTAAAVEKHCGSAFLAWAFAQPGGGKPE